MNNYPKPGGPKPRPKVKITKKPINGGPSWPIPHKLPGGTNGGKEIL